MGEIFLAPSKREMDALTPTEPHTHNGDGPQCLHGLLHDGQCGDLRYRFVEDRSAYFTSWNFFLIIAALALVLLVYLPANLIDGGSFLRGKYGFLVNYIVTPLIIMSVIGSIGVLLTSQSIVAFNFQQMVEIGHIPPIRHLVQEEEARHERVADARRLADVNRARLSPGQGTATRLETDSAAVAEQLNRRAGFSPIRLAKQTPDVAGAPKDTTSTSTPKDAWLKRTLAHPEVDSSRVSVQINYLEYLLQDNFVVHIAPAIIAVVILMLLAVGTFQTAERETVSLVVLIFCLVIWAIYFAVPVKDRETGESHVGWNKIAHVYSEPSGWIFAGQFVFSAAAAFMIPFFIIGKGPSSMDQIQGISTGEPLMPDLEAFVNQLTAGSSAAGTAAVAETTAASTFTRLGPVRAVA